jgi:protoporphyrin/coproporphyrin ferrochelatase
MERIMAPYDAFLLVSFGGPEGPDDVLPFLRNVTAGRAVPAERLAEVAEHYQMFGGVSPINAQCRDLLDAVGKEFAVRGIDLPLYWGNRNWQPYLADTLARMGADGISRAVAFVTSPYSSYSSCRQYLDDIERARAAVGPAAPQVDKLRQYFSHPGFVQSLISAAATARDSLTGSVPEEIDLVFTAHSVPVSMAAASGPAGGAYPAQLAEVARLVAEGLGTPKRCRMAYSSRSGPPSQPWLEPDVNDLLTELAEAGSPGVVVVPIGFISDHMEVRFDLDVEAAQTAQAVGLPFARAATPGTDPRFVAMVGDLVAERISGAPRQALGDLDPGRDVCPAGCCGGPGGGRPSARRGPGASPSQGHGAGG